MSGGIAIVTCLHRTSAELIAETLGSVERQSTAPAEHILVVGDVGGDVRKLCCEYDSRVPYAVNIYEQEPRGIYAAINEGIQRTTAPIVGLLHGGDRLLTSEVLATVQYEMSVGNAALIYGDIRYATGRYYSGRHFRPSSLRNGFMFPHPSMYCRREVFDRYGLYAEDYRVGADFEWLVRVLLVGGVSARYVPLCMVEMASGGTSMSLWHRLTVTPREKLRALRAHGHPVCPLRMLTRYAYALLPR